jgi:hypothetical protein
VLLVHSDMGAEGAASDRRRFWSITSTVSNAWGQVAALRDVRPAARPPGQFMKIDQFSVVPEMSPVEFRAFTEIGVYCHEFGHDLGWPDLYDASSLGGGTEPRPGQLVPDVDRARSAATAARRRGRPIPAPGRKWDAGWIGLENLVDDGDHRFAPVWRREDGLPPVVPGRGVGRMVPAREPAEDRLRLGPARARPAGHAHPVRRDGAEAAAQHRQFGRDPGAARRGGGRALRHDVHHQSRRRARPVPGPPARATFADDTSPRPRRTTTRPLNTSLQAIREIGTDVRAYVQLLPTGWSQPLEIGPIGPGGASAATARRRWSPIRRATCGSPRWTTCRGASEIVAAAEALRHRLGARRAADERARRVELARARDRPERAQGDRWWDTRDGNSEIYYAWAPPGGRSGRRGG